MKSATAIGHSSTCKHQQGYVLIISLVLLIILTLVGLAGLQGSLLQERMAGGHKHMLDAYMAAEAGMLTTQMGIREQARANLSWIPPGEIIWTGNDLKEQIQVLADSGHSREARRPFMGDQSAWWVESVSFDDGVARITTRGLTPSQSTAAVTSQIRVSGEPAVQGAYGNALVACEGLQLAGSGLINSYDSKGGTKAYSVSTAAANASVATILPPGNISLTGSSPIYGDVTATGTVSATGSAPVFGNVHANGNVLLDGGGVVLHKNVQSRGNIQYSSSAVVNGNLYANEKIQFDNWHAYTHGNAFAGGNFTHQRPTVAGHVGGTHQANTSPGVPEVATPPCDPLEIAAPLNVLRNSLPGSGNLPVGNWPRVNYRLMPNGVSYREGDASTPWIPDQPRTDALLVRPVFERPMPTLKTGNLTIGSGGSLRIGEAGGPGGDIALVVDGNLSIGGGGNGLVIAPGYTLTLFVTGRVDINSNIQAGSGATVLERNGILLPVFSIYSSSSQPVTLEGSSKTYASIYAPHAHVLIRGSGELFGTARGKSLRVEGTGQIHYDESLALAGPSVPGAQATFSASILSWRQH